MDLNYVAADELYQKISDKQYDQKQQYYFGLCGDKISHQEYKANRLFGYFTGIWEGAFQECHRERMKNLDPLSEIEVYNMIYRLAGDRIVIFISHRLGFARQTDRILVFQKGEIAEQGSYEELMAVEGIYRKMFITQASWYQDRGEIRLEQNCLCRTGLLQFCIGIYCLASAFQCRDPA